MKNITLWLVVWSILGSMAPLWAAPKHTEPEMKAKHAPAKTVAKTPANVKPDPAKPDVDEEGVAASDIPVADETSATTVGETQTSYLVDKSGRAFPYYASLKKTEVNVRSGPGNQYPILWIYQRAGYPVHVLTRYDNYYKVRDVEGEEGWVYVGMVSKRLTALVGGDKPTNLYKKADTSGAVLARLAPDVVVELEKCNTDTLAMCQVVAMDTKGWVLKSVLQMVE